MPDRDTCAVCETVFDGDTPRTTPGCELCGTCEACGCQINPFTMDTEAAIQRSIMQIAGLTHNSDGLYHDARRKLELVEAHKREVA